MVYRGFRDDSEYAIANVTRSLHVGIIGTLSLLEMLREPTASVRLVLLESRPRSRFSQFCRGKTESSPTASQDLLSTDGSSWDERCLRQVS